MSPRTRICLTVLMVLCVALVPSALRAGPTETAIVAAMKLQDAKSYTWITAVEDDARTYDVHGLTDKSDFSVVSMPMVSVLRRRLSRGSSNTDNQVEAIFKGAEKCVIQTPAGWKTPAEVAEQRRIDQRAANSGEGAYPGVGGNVGGFPGSGFPSGSRRRGGSGPGGAPLPYSNLQLNLSRPAEEIGVIVGSYTDIKADGDAVSGTLSETGAKLLLVHPGQDELTPLKASGTFRFWIRDGVLVKYELKLDGTLAVETPSARREVTVHQKSTTEIKAINTTIVEVPEEARKKLGG